MRSVAALFALIAGQCLGQSQAPSVILKNKVLRAKVYLPNTDSGYYRGTRFDWSGVIASLEYKGHNFFGVWFPRYDPKLHDSITGPVEEFRNGNTTFGSALGYEQAKPGGTFVKIGVGELRKPDDRSYAFARSYELVNTGKWTCRPHSDSIEFMQELDTELGYAYTYEKTVRLEGSKPVLLLQHKLRNTGKRVIETDVYDHDFFVLDSQPTGPGTTIRFRFAPKPADEPTWSTAKDLLPYASIQGNTIAYTQQLMPRESAASLLTGFQSKVKDNDIRVENSNAGIGIHETGNRPMVRLNLWSIRTTVCPEAYIHLKIKPGEVATWTIRYEVYLLPKSAER